MRSDQQETLTIPDAYAHTYAHSYELHQEAKEAGCDEVLTKPCRPDAFIDHVEGFIPNNDLATKTR